MKKMKLVIAGITAFIFLYSTLPVCLAAPSEVLNEEGVSYVMSGFKAFYLDDDIYYHKQGVDEYGAQIEIPAGEYYVTFKLQALIATYPKGKFAVRFRPDDGGKILSEPESKTTYAELERLRNAGVDSVIIQEKTETLYSTYFYAILTAEQINNFPVSDKFGYRMGLATKPEEIYDSTKLNEGDSFQKKGDINGDKNIDVEDLSYLSLYLIGDKYLSEEWLKAADVDDDEMVTLADLARLQQYLSKKIDTLG